MFDRPTVLSLAREWDFAETADWSESVDTGTYGRLIILGPDVIEDDSASGENAADLSHLASEDQAISHVGGNDVNDIDVTDMAVEHVRRTMHDLIASLGKQATLTIADTYMTEQMGVEFAPSRRDVIHAERDALIRHLGQTSTLWLQLDEAMADVQRGVGSLRFLIDPENN
jgi:hypothetical protein